jgi:hypothetical protein
MYYTNLLKFYQYLDEEIATNLTMGIGISVLDSIDTDRNLSFDITLSNYSDSDAKKLKDTSDKGIVLNYDFNSLCVLNNRIIDKFNKINKINSIVFDSSTFKFFNNIKFLASLYYLTLETNGSIYIESNSSISIGYVIRNTNEFYELLNKNKGGFRYQNGYILLNDVKSLISNDKFEIMEKSIISREQVYIDNQKFLEKWFYGSKVEILENKDINYPITNPRYEIKKYYKITKNLEHKEILEYLKMNIKEINEGLELKSVNLFNNL